MSFLETVERARAFLERNGRVSLRALQREFSLDDEPVRPELMDLHAAVYALWACDYPHPDSTWPESRKAIKEALGTLSDEAVRMVTAENCRRLYRLG